MSCASTDRRVICGLGWHQVEILSVESSGVNVNRGSSGFHALSHLYNSVNKWWHKESSKKQSRPASPGTEQGTGDSFRAPRSYRKATQDIQPPVARFTFGDQSKQTPVTLDPPGTSASAGRPKLLTDPAMLPSPLVLSQGKADSAIVPGESKGMEGQDGELFVPPTPRSGCLCSRRFCVWCAAYIAAACVRAVQRIEPLWRPVRTCRVLGTLG